MLFTLLMVSVKTMSMLSKRKIPCWDVTCRWMNVWRLLSQNSAQTWPLQRTSLTIQTKAAPHPQVLSITLFYFSLSLITPWNYLICLSVTCFLPLTHQKASSVGLGSHLPFLTVSPADSMLPGAHICWGNRWRAKLVCFFERVSPFSCSEEREACTNS